MLDFVHDFHIRCNRCHKSKWAAYELRSAINAWNNNDLKTLINTSAERFLNHLNEPIKYMALDEHSACFDDNQWDCGEVIIAVGDSLFKVSGQRVAEDLYDFNFEEIPEYDRKMWPYLIQATMEEPIRFIRFEREPHMDAVIRISIGNRPVLITAEEAGVMIGISHWNPDGEWLDFDNNVLLNGNQG